MYEDKTLICKDCGKEFIFTAGEQEFYAEKGFQNEPQRCKECRTARTLPRPAESISLLPALIAAARLRFLSSPEKTDLYIAAIALQNRRKTNLII